MAALSLTLCVLGVWLIWQPGRDRIAGGLLCLGALLTWGGSFSVAGPWLLAGVPLLVAGGGTLLSTTLN